MAGEQLEPQLPEPLMYEIRTAFDDGVQFGFRQVVEMIDAILPLVENKSRVEAYRFVRDWCETTALDIAMDAPSADKKG